MLSGWTWDQPRNRAEAFRWLCRYLTGEPGAGRPGFRNAISLDQFAADHSGSQTRFPSLCFSGEGAGLSWTRTGALVTAAISPSKVFAGLFLEGKADEVQSQVRRLEDGRSILDDVRDQAKSLRSDLGTDDRDKLDEYLKQTQEEGARLLDRTTVFLGSNLGDGSSYSVKNLPVLLAGGGFRHGQHAPRLRPAEPAPLCNLPVLRSTC